MNRALKRFLGLGGTWLSKKYEALTKSEKRCNFTNCTTLLYHILEIGLLTKKSFRPEYFDCLPRLNELELETEQNDPTVCISFSSFLDETNCSVPDLEELPNPDSTDVPSFLGQNYQARDCARVLRSNRKSSSNYHQFSL